jgi:hypothetical protein
MDLLRCCGGVFVYEQSAQSAQLAETCQPLRTDHPDPLERLKVAAGVEVVATRAYLGELEPECC